MNRRALVFTGPRRVEVVEEAIELPGPGEVLVQARFSAISAGTPCAGDPRSRLQIS